MAPKQSPAVHPKRAPTGLGIKPQVPGNAGKVSGPSLHTPVTGKDYSNEQQQGGERPR